MRRKGEDGDEEETGEGEEEEGEEGNGGTEEKTQAGQAHREEVARDEKKQRPYREEPSGTSREKELERSLL